MSKIIIADNISGECASIESISNSSIKALKRWIMIIKKYYNEHSHFYIVNCEDVNVYTYFEKYLFKVNS